MERRKEFDLDQAQGLVVQGGNTGLEIVGEAAERPYVVCAVDSEDAPDPIEIVSHDDRLIISVGPRSDGARGETVRIHVPSEERSIHAETSNGGVAMQGLAGTLSVNATNGKVELRDCKGTMTVVCANGSIDGENLDGKLEASTANGRVSVREARLDDGAIKSGNGRVGLQVRPGAAGTLSVFAGNGRVEIGLPEDGDYRVKIKSKGRLQNHLQSYTVSTEDETTIVEKGSGAFGILIQNFQGGVKLVKYQDFGKRLEESGPFSGFDAGDLGEFLSNLGGCFQGMPENLDFDFSAEIPKIATKMKAMGMRFGKMGEEFSRQFHESHHGGSNSSTREVDMILDMLKEGKLTAEEAERLINAIRAK